jgi:hypothetical protein
MPPVVELGCLLVSRLTAPAGARQFDDRLLAFASGSQRVSDKMGLVW